MVRTLEYDIFDAMVDRLLCPMRPLEERRKAAAPKTDPSDVRPARNLSNTPLSN